MAVTRDQSVFIYTYQFDVVRGTVIPDSDTSAYFETMPALPRTAACQAAIDAFYDRIDLFTRFAHQKDGVSTCVFGEFVDIALTGFDTPTHADVAVRCEPAHLASLFKQLQQTVGGTSRETPHETFHEFAIGEHFTVTVHFATTAEAYTTLLHNQRYTMGRAGDACGHSARVAERDNVFVVIRPEQLFSLALTRIQLRVQQARVEEQQILARIQEEETRVRTLSGFITNGHTTLHMLQHERDQHQQALARAIENEKQAEARIETLKTTFDAQVEQFLKQQTEHHQLQSELRVLQETIAQKQQIVTTVSHEEAAVAQAIAERQEALNQRDRAKAEYDVFQQGIADAKAERDAYAASKLADKEKIKAEMAKAWEDRKTAEAATRAAQAELEKMQTKTRHARTEMEKMKTEAGEARAEMERVKSEANDARAEMKRVKSEANDARAEMEKDKIEAAVARAEMERVKAELEALKAERAAFLTREKQDQPSTRGTVSMTQDTGCAVAGGAAGAAAGATGEQEDNDEDQVASGDVQDAGKEKEQKKKKKKKRKGNGKGKAEEGVVAEPVIELPPLTELVDPVRHSRFWLSDGVVVDEEGKKRSEKLYPKFKAAHPLTLKSKFSDQFKADDILTKGLCLKYLKNSVKDTFPEHKLVFLETGLQEKIVTAPNKLYVMCNKGVLHIILEQNGSLVNESLTSEELGVAIPQPFTRKKMESISSEIGRAIQRKVDFVQDDVEFIMTHAAHIEFLLNAYVAPDEDICNAVKPGTTSYNLVQAAISRLFDYTLELAKKDRTPEVVRELNFAFKLCQQRVAQAPRHTAAAVRACAGEAIERGLFVVYKWMFECGLDPNELSVKGDTILHEIIRCSRSDKVVIRECAVALSHGALINVQNSEQETPLIAFISTAENPVACAQWLLEQGADPLTEDEIGNDAIATAVYTIERTPESVKFIRELLEKYQDYTMSKCQKLLAVAANRGWFEIVLLVAERMGDITQVMDENGDNPLHMSLKIRNAYEYYDADIQAAHDQTIAYFINAGFVPDKKAYALACEKHIPLKTILMQAQQARAAEVVDEAVAGPAPVAAVEAVAPAPAVAARHRRGSYAGFGTFDQSEGGTLRRVKSVGCLR